MVRSHNWRLLEIQIQKQLSACLILAEDVKYSVEWASEPTHLATALVCRNHLLRVGENIADLMR